MPLDGSSKKSVRTYDTDGRLHVATSNISKAMVCPYRGNEIPGAERLGLEPGKVYHLLRDPQELARSAPTFNKIPLLGKHVHATADDPQTDHVVGTTGTECVFEDPYLKNSLAIWDGKAIAKVEHEAVRELSASYHYDPDMTPGTFRGARYDGVMRNIRGNHVALVEDGRAGNDVLVMDAAMEPEGADPTYDAEFDEAKVKRGEGGKFAANAGGSSEGMAHHAAKSHEARNGPGGGHVARPHARAAKGYAAALEHYEAGREDEGHAAHKDAAAHGAVAAGREKRAGGAAAPAAKPEAAKPNILPEAEHAAEVAKLAAKSAPLPTAPKPGAEAAAVPAEVLSPEAAKPEAAKPEAAKPEAAKPDTSGTKMTPGKHYLSSGVHSVTSKFSPGGMKQVPAKAYDVHHNGEHIGSVNTATGSGKIKSGGKSFSDGKSKLYWAAQAKGGMGVGTGFRHGSAASAAESLVNHHLANKKTPTKDSKLAGDSQLELSMKVRQKVALSQRAAMAKGARMAQTLLANDASAAGLSALLEALDPGDQVKANPSEAAIPGGPDDAAAPNPLAAEPAVLGDPQGTNPAGEGGTDPGGEEDLGKDDDIEGKVRELLTGKLDDADLEMLLKLIRPDGAEPAAMDPDAGQDPDAGSDPDEETDLDAAPAAPDDDDVNEDELPPNLQQGKEKAPVMKPAMDAAIKAASAANVAEAVRQTTVKMNAIRDAERFVRPWIGEVVVAMDSASAVYALALEKHNIPTKGVHPSAFRSILALVPKPGDVAPRGATPARVAMDEKTHKTLTERFPGLNRVRVMG